MTQRPHSSWTPFETLEPRQLLAFVHWDGGGGDNDWHNPLNWSGDSLPGAADEVFIEVAGSPTIRIGQDVSVKRIWSREAVEVVAGTVSVAELWKQAAAFTFAGGTLTGAGHLELNADMSWTGGTIAGGASKIQVLPGTKLTIGGNVSLARQLVNNGEVLWSAGTITATDARIYNLSNRTFMITGGAAMVRSGAQSYFSNYGELIRDGAAGTTTTIGVSFLNQLHLGWIILPPYPVNPGFVEVKSGTLEFSGPVSTGPTGFGIAGPVWKATSSDATLLLPQTAPGHAWGTYVLSGAGSRISILETATSVDALELSGGRAFDFVGLLQNGVAVDRLIIDNPGTSMTLPTLSGSGLELRGGNLHIVGGAQMRRFGFWLASTVVVDSDATLTLGGVSVMDNTYISGGGLIRVNGELQWGSGGMSGPGQLLIAPAGRLVSHQAFGFSSNYRSIERRIVNYGVIDINLSGFYIWSMSAELVNRGTLNLNASGESFIETTAGTSMIQAPGFITNLGVINSYGNITLRGAGGGLRVNNQGTIHALSGVLIFNGGAYGGGVWRAEAGAEIAYGGLGSVMHNATLSGEGHIRVAATALWTNTTVLDQGTMAVTAPGRLTLSGGFTSITRASFANAGIISTLWEVAINASVVNAGTLNLSIYRLAINGNLSLTPLSRIEIAIQQFSFPAASRLTVTGHTAIAGRLAAAFSGSHSDGSTYDVLTTGSSSGGFGEVTATGLQAGRFALFSFVGPVGKLRVASI